MLFDGRDIEPAGNLRSDPYGEVSPVAIQQPAALNLALEGRPISISAFEDVIRMAQSVGYGASG